MNDEYDEAPDGFVYLDDAPLGFGHVSIDEDGEPEPEQRPALWLPCPDRRGGYVKRTIQRPAVQSFGFRLGMRGKGPR